MADAYQKVKDWLMARGALGQAAGTQPVAAPVAQPAAQGYLAQQIAANPNNQQPAQFETALNPQEEAQFQQWKLKNAPNDSGVDYDLRGAFKAGLSPATNGHWPDTFKKPNHPTFSAESIYATPNAPTWRGGNTLVDNIGRIVADESVSPVSNKLKAGRK